MAPTDTAEERAEKTAPAGFVQPGARQLTCGTAEKCRGHDIGMVHTCFTHHAHTCIHITYTRIHG